MATLWSRRWAVVVLLAGLAAACARSTQVPDELPSTLPAAGGGPEALVCYAARSLVYVTADGRVTRPLAPQPPEDLVGLARVGELLIGAGQGTVYAYRGGAWDLLARFGPPEHSVVPVRVAAYRDRVLVWLRALKSNAVPAALSVDAQAAVSVYPAEAARRSVGELWQGAGIPEGPPSPGFPPALRLLLAEVRMSGQYPKERLVHGEPSWWGGQLVAPDLGGGGEWTQAPLFLLRDPERGPPVPLVYDEQPIVVRALIGYGGDQSLYLDGRFSSAKRGVLRVLPPHRQRRRDQLAAQPLPGLSAPCAVLPPT
ncbi:MAG: hypothetical protein U1A78_19445 [Polyangia bacterium]